jgi:hypothetical protein
VRDYALEFRAGPVQRTGPTTRTALQFTGSGPAGEKTTWQLRIRHPGTGEQVGRSSSYTSGLITCSSSARTWSTFSTFIRSSSRTRPGRST